MASAARLAPAANSEASSTVRLGSWLITELTMLIITCRRLISRASSAESVALCRARCKFFPWSAGSPIFMLTPFPPEQLPQQNTHNVDVASALLCLLSAILHPLAEKANCPKVLGLARGRQSHPFGQEGPSTECHQSGRSVRIAGCEVCAVFEAADFEKRRFYGRAPRYDSGRKTPPRSQRKTGEGLRQRTGAGGDGGEG